VLVQILESQVPAVEVERKEIREEVDRLLTFIVNVPDVVFPPLGQAFEQMRRTSVRDLELAPSGGSKELCR
jgi:hypothetical protein